MPDATSLEIFHHIFASVAEEMGVTLGRTAYSPNIKERRDYSCALFLGDGRLLAQAAHIPVHLGAMPASVRAAIETAGPYVPGDVVVLNDPYLGGTHLPDITLVSPVFVSEKSQGATLRLTAAETPDFFVASRAHHADVGGSAPGSLPLARELFAEGLIIPPVKLVAAGRRNDAVEQLILRNVRTPQERRGDLAAQLAAHEVGARRLAEIVARHGRGTVQAHAEALLAYAERLARAAIAALPDGAYHFEDVLEVAEDNPPAPRTSHPAPLHPAPLLAVTVTVRGDTLRADFTGTSTAMDGPLNAVPAIVESALGYVLRCIAGEALPLNAGAFAPLSLHIPPGSLLDPGPPHAVGGGNVETSQRVVDVVFGALALALPGRIPAASQGTMNNIMFGGRDPRTGAAFAYYETLGGGLGAGPGGPGGSGMHAHMSNTLNTPVEVLEHAYPVRVRRYGLRRDSGGAGRHRGGDGLVREIEFLAPAQLTLLTTRRVTRPYGLQGGGPGQAGRNLLVRHADLQETATAAEVHELPAQAAIMVEAGDVLRIETPGGGGWGG